jgi:hypothetical protein
MSLMPFSPAQLEACREDCPIRYRYRGKGAGFNDLGRVFN